MSKSVNDFRESASSFRDCAGRCAVVRSACVPQFVSTVASRHDPARPRDIEGPWHTHGRHRDVRCAERDVDEAEGVGLVGHRVARVLGAQDVGVACGTGGDGRLVVLVLRVVGKEQTLLAGVGNAGDSNTMDAAFDDAEFDIAQSHAV